MYRSEKGMSYMYNVYCWYSSSLKYPLNHRCFMTSFSNRLLLTDFTKKSLTSILIGCDWYEQNMLVQQGCCSSEWLFCSKMTPRWCSLNSWTVGFHSPNVHSPADSTNHTASFNAKGDVEIRCLADEASRRQFVPVDAGSELISDYVVLKLLFAFRVIQWSFVQILEWSYCGLCMTLPIFECRLQILAFLL